MASRHSPQPAARLRDIEGLSGYIDARAQFVALAAAALLPAGCGSRSPARLLTRCSLSDHIGPRWVLAPAHRLVVSAHSDFAVPGADPRAHASLFLVVSPTLGLVSASLCTREIGTGVWADPRTLVYEQRRGFEVQRVEGNDATRTLWGVADFPGVMRAYDKDIIANHKWIVCFRERHGFILERMRRSDDGDEAGMAPCPPLWSKYVPLSGLQHVEFTCLFHEKGLIRGGDELSVVQKKKGKTRFFQIDLENTFVSGGVINPVNHITTPFEVGKGPMWHPVTSAIILPATVTTNTTGNKRSGSVEYCLVSLPSNTVLNKFMRLPVKLDDSHFVVHDSDTSVSVYSVTDAKNPCKVLNCQPKSCPYQLLCCCQGFLCCLEQENTVKVYHPMTGTEVISFVPHTKISAPRLHSLCQS
ncbi:hypothetical protein Pelo_14095 [Pelomyxa schiedti]|nr:hypothetical protein Pelo_14095 [Pelomyxa schiedti]